MVDLPEEFMETAIAHFDLSEGSEGSSSEDSSTANTATPGPTLHTIGTNHYVATVASNSASPEANGDKSASVDYFSKEDFQSIVEILVKYPQPNRVFRPSYNIPPTRSSVIIFQSNNDKASPTVDYKYVIESLSFGLVPSWAKPKDPEPVQRNGNPGPPYSKEIQRFQGRQFNCRKESMGKGNALPTWNSHKKKTRCVVPIEGYFEWLRLPRDENIPHYIHSTSSSLIYLAGLYSHNFNYKMDESDEYFSSFAIVTGPTNKRDNFKDLSWLHTRKPIMLIPGSKEWFEWLDPERDWDDLLMDTVLDTTKNKAYKDIDAYVVGKAVGKIGSHGPELIERKKGPSVSPQKPITLFFQRKKPADSAEDGGSPKKRIKVESRGTEGKGDILSAMTGSQKKAPEDVKGIFGSESYLNVKKEEEGDEVEVEE